MKGKILVRQEKEADFSFVHEVNRLAFGQDDEADLVDSLRKNKDVFIPELSIVAVTDSEIVGHILFTRIKIINDRGSAHDSLALAPMAVNPRFQRRGIGKQLVKSGLEKAIKLGFSSVIVLGHEDYYPTFGFKPAHEWNIKAPFDVPENVFMGIELIPGALKGVEGFVKYPKEFGI